MTEHSLNETATRAGFVVIGVFSALLAIFEITPVLAVIARGSPDHFGFDDIPLLAAVLVVPSLLFLCSFTLIRYSPSFAASLLRSSQPTPPYWEQAAYRLGSTFCGVLVISWALPKATAIAANVITMNTTDMPSDLFADGPRMTWVMALHFIIQAMIGVYLFVGAPRLMKWQVSRCEALPECDNPEETPGSRDE